jgi:hypothetical protein
MSIYNIDKYLLRYIMKYIDTNQSSYYLVLTCRDIYNTFRNEGFLKQVYLNPHNSYILDKIVYHYKYLYVLNINNLYNPHKWIHFPWPKIVILNHCIFTDIINPPLSLKTKYLYITTFNNNVQINMLKFPNLLQYKIN